MKKIIVAVLTLAMLLQSSLIFATEEAYKGVLDVPTSLGVGTGSKFADSIRIKPNEMIDLRASIDMKVVRDKFLTEVKFVEDTIIKDDAAKKAKFEAAKVTGSFTITLKHDEKVVLPEAITKGTDLAGFNAEASNIFVEESREDKDGVFTIKVKVAGPKGEGDVRTDCTVKALVDNIDTWLADMTLTLSEIPVGSAGVFEFVGDMTGSTHIEVASGYGQDIDFKAVPVEGEEDIAVTVTARRNDSSAATGIAVTPSTEDPDVDVNLPNNEYAAKVFVDVEADDWYADAVGYVTKLGLMNGTSDEEFSPEIDTTRGMVVTILWRLSNSPEFEATDAYTDVEADEYYTQAIAWGTSVGVAKGYGEKIFAPNKVVSREELAAFFNRYAEFMEKSDGIEVKDIDEYADVDDISDWAYENVKWALNAGLLEGKGSGIIDPLNDTLRSELAAVIMRYCENISK